MADRQRMAEAATRTPLLQVQAVHKRFETAGGEVEALRAVSLAVARGEFVCLIGASGAANRPCCA